jgi:hypothetical protein
VDPKIEPTEPANEQSEATKPAIVKPPKKFDLSAFKSSAFKKTIPKLVPALPVYRMADANDFVRLHHDEENYWSTELCFVNVPVKGKQGTVAPHHRRAGITLSTSGANHLT